MDDAILGQLPPPPANGVQATESLIQHDVAMTGGRNRIGNGGLSLTFAGELVGSQGIVIEICWPKGPDPGGYEHSQAFNSTVPNN